MSSCSSRASSVRSADEAPPPVEGGFEESGRSLGPAEGRREEGGAAGADCPPSGGEGCPTSRAFFQGRPSVPIALGPNRVVDDSLVDGEARPEITPSHDLLPLPVGASLHACLFGWRDRAAMSGGQLRKARRQRAEERWLEKGIVALNTLGGRGILPSASGPPTAAQVAAIRRLARCYGHLPVDSECLSPQAAWKALLGERTGYTDSRGANGNIASFRRGAVALPSCVAGLVSLEEVLPPALRDTVLGVEGLLRPSEEVEPDLLDFGGSLAMDPRLAGGSDCYAGLLEDLLEKGIVEVDSEITETCGLFVVKKKDGRQRLIFDTRRSNLHFRVPPYTSLCSGEALASLRCPLPGPCWLREADVECCFYQFALPKQLRRFFGLPPVSVSKLSRATREKFCSHLSGDQNLRVRARVVPMGWSWAVHLVQEGHLNIMKRRSPRVGFLIKWGPPRSPTAVKFSFCTSTTSRLFQPIARLRTLACPNLPPSLSGKVLF